MNTWLKKRAGQRAARRDGQIQRNCSGVPLDLAEEVELVDVSPHALRQRMQHENICPTERVEAALNHFFCESNLTALRELALRRVVERLNPTWPIRP